MDIFSVAVDTSINRAQDALTIEVGLVDSKLGFINIKGLLLSKEIPLDEGEKANHRLGASVCSGYS